MAARHNNQSINESVLSIAQSNLSMPSIPRAWFDKIKMRNGKTDANGIIVLSEIMKWYEPAYIPDSDGGYEIAQRFDGDALQISYGQLSFAVGLTKNQVRMAIDRMVKSGILKREFKTIDIEGKKINNVMFVEPIIDAIIDDENTPKPLSKNNQSTPETLSENNQSAPEYLSKNNQSTPKNLSKNIQSSTQKTLPIEKYSETNTVSSYITTCIVNDRTERNRTKLNGAADKKSHPSTEGSGQGRKRTVNEAMAEVMKSRQEEGRIPVSEQEGRLRPLHKQMFDKMAGESKRVQDEDTQWGFSVGHIEDLEASAESVGLGLDDVAKAIWRVYEKFGACGKTISFWLNDFKDTIKAEIALLKNDLSWDYVAANGLSSMSAACC